MNGQIVVYFSQFPLMGESQLNSKERSKDEIFSQFDLRVCNCTVIRLQRLRQENQNRRFFNVRIQIGSIRI